jgi:hypothetical protein
LNEETGRKRPPSDLIFDATNVLLGTHFLKPLSEVTSGHLPTRKLGTQQSLCPVLPFPLGSRHTYTKVLYAAGHKSL